MYLVVVGIGNENRVLGFKWRQFFFFFFNFLFSNVQMKMQIIEYNSGFQPGAWDLM